MQRSHACRHFGVCYANRVRARHQRHHAARKNARQRRIARNRNVREGRFDLARRQIRRVSARQDLYHRRWIRRSEARACEGQRILDPGANLRPYTVRDIRLCCNGCNDRWIHDPDLRRNVARLAVRIDNLELILAREKGRIRVNYGFHRLRVDEVHVRNLDLLVTLNQVHLGQLDRLSIRERSDGKG